MQATLEGLGRKALCVLCSLVLACGLLPTFTPGTAESAYAATTYTVSFVQSDGETASMTAAYIDEATAAANADGTYTVSFTFNETGASYIGAVYYSGSTTYADSDALTADADGVYSITVDSIDELIPVGFYVSIMGSTATAYISVTATTTDDEGDGTDDTDEGEHSYVAGEADENGVVVYTCETCGDTYSVYPFDVYYKHAVTTNYSTYFGTEATVVDNGDGTWDVTIVVDATNSMLSDVAMLFDDDVVYTEEADDEGYITYVLTVDDLTATIDFDFTYTIAAMGMTHTYAFQIVLAGGTWTEHELEVSETVDATCTEDGSVTYTCTEENCSYTTTEVVAAAHSYVAGEADDDGVVVYTCSVCGDTYSVYPFDVYYKCAVTTNYSTYFGTEATVVDNGDGTYDVTFVINATNSMLSDVAMIFGDDVVYTETADDEGYITYVLTLDDLTATIDFQFTYTVAAMSMTHTYPFQIVLAGGTWSGHELTYIEATDATCTEEGSSPSAYYCSTCGKYFSDEDAAEEVEVTTTEALGHSYEATSYESGLTEYVCANDSSHTYATTTYDGVQYITADVTYDGAGTYASMGTIVNTMVAKYYGADVFVAQLCDGTYNVVVYFGGTTGYSSAIGDITLYTSSDLDSDTATTVTQQEETEFYADDAENAYVYVLNVESIDEALYLGLHVGGAMNMDITYCMTIDTEDVEVSTQEHNYVAEVTDPTCTESGYTTYTCSRCGDAYTADETEALGHDYVASTDDNGLTYYECSRCGDTYYGFTLYYKCADKTSSYGGYFEVTGVEANEDGTYSITIVADGTSSALTDVAMIFDEEYAATSTTDDEGYITYVITVDDPADTIDFQFTYTIAAMSRTNTHSFQMVLEGGTWSGHDYEATTDDSGVVLYTCSRCGDTYANFDVYYKCAVTTNYSTYFGTTAGVEDNGDGTWDVTIVINATSSMLSDVAMIFDDDVVYTEDADDEGYITYVLTVDDLTATIDFQFTYTVAAMSMTHTFPFQIVLEGGTWSGHVEAEAVAENSVAPTCTEEGSYDSVVYCSTCGTELSRETVAVDALGHNYETTTDDNGVTMYVCTRCGDSYYVNNLVRIAGANRYETAALEATQAYDSADTVVLATGKNYADALTATALAGALEAPILLTDPAELSAAAAEAIAALGAETVVVVGGESAVSADVVTVLEASGLSVERIAGANRYETAEEIYFYGLELDAWGDAVLVASGTGFADALSASSMAYAAGWPILLANASGELDDASTALVRLAAADGKDIVALGGTSAVAELSRETARLGGANRYETSVLIAEYAVEAGILAWDNVAFATGANFPDALAGSALQGADGAVLLLVADGHTADAVELLAGADGAEGVAGEIVSARILGGTSAVSEDVQAEIVAALGWADGEWEYVVVDGSDGADADEGDDDGDEEAEATSYTVSFVQSDGETASMTAAYIDEATAAANADGTYTVSFTFNETGASYIGAVYYSGSTTYTDGDALTADADGVYSITVDSIDELIPVGFYVSIMGSTATAYISVTAA